MKLQLQHPTRSSSWDQAQPCSFPTHLPPSVLLTGSSPPSFLQDNLKLCFKWGSYSAWHFNKMECDFSTRGFFGVTTSFVASDWSQKNTLISWERAYYIKFPPSTSSTQINLRSNNHVLFFCYIHKHFKWKMVGFEIDICQGFGFFFILKHFFLKSSNVFHLETFFSSLQTEELQEKKIHKNNPQKKKGYRWKSLLAVCHEMED